jgi:hypothetical protein
VAAMAKGLGVERGAMSYIILSQATFTYYIYGDLQSVKSLFQ